MNKISADPATFPRNYSTNRYESSSEESNSANIKQNRGVAISIDLDSDCEGNLSIDNYN